MAEKEKDKNQFVAIGASLAGILMVITVLFLIFASSQLEFLLGIAWGFVILGVFLGFFQYLALKNRK